MSTANPQILLLSGPNLNLLGSREPEIYGRSTLDDLVEAATHEAGALGLDVHHLQSNHEGDLVDEIHSACGRMAGIVINAGAFSHYSWAIHDALASFAGPVIELHISNPGAREDFRHDSVITAVATAVISGLGAAGYPLAMRAMAGLLEPTV
jgi:3-dehydroquinate dehydratase-2